MRDTTHVIYLHARLRTLELTSPGGARFSSTLCHDARLPTLLMTTSHARHPGVPASRASRLLPPDIVPLVLAHLSWRVRDLGACCLVNTLWRRYATPYLYERIWLRDQKRLLLVFRTLAECPHLARYVRIMEIRVYPFGLPAEKLEDVEASIVQALHHAVNLVELCWTRAGSLNDRVLMTIFDNMRCMRKLELSGSGQMSSQMWEPKLLVSHLPRTVETLSLIMPSREVVNELVHIAKHLDNCLFSLQLLCMNSAVVTDGLLCDLAPHVPRLSRLSLVGCKRVHGPGVRALVNKPIRDLSLESVALDVGVLATLAPDVVHLRRLTLTPPRHVRDMKSFYDEASVLIDACNALECLTLYARGGSKPVVGHDLGSTGDTSRLGEDQADLDVHVNHEVQPPSSQQQLTPSSPYISTLYMARLCASSSAHSLKTLRIQGLGMSLDTLSMLAQSPLKHVLRDLDIHLCEDNVPKLIACIASFERLESLHIFSDLQSHAQLSDGDILRIAREAGGEWFCQIGFQNRVWHVRSTRQGRELIPWDKSAGTFPQSMLVVRS